MASDTQKRPDDGCIFEGDRFEAASDENIDSDILRAYRRHHSINALLDAHEEQQLALAIAQGKEAQERLLRGEAREAEVGHIVHAGQEARVRLITANVRLVMSIASKYKGRGAPVEDLVQEGIIGLMYAVEKFDPARGKRFSTYATPWIRREISAALRRHATLIGLPRQAYAALPKIGAALGRLKLHLGRVPSYGELAQDVGSTERAVRDTLEASRIILSLDATLPLEDETITLGEHIAAPFDAPSGASLDPARASAAVAEALAALAPRHRRIVTLRYGLEDGQQRTLQEIAEMLGVTRSRVHQIVSASLDAVKKKLGL